MGVDLFTKTIPEYLKGKIKPEPQDHDEATLTKKFTTEEAFIEEADLEDEKEADHIDRKIRALNPEPGTWTILEGKRTKLLEAEVKDGKLKLKRTQVAGKTPRDVQ